MPILLLLFCFVFFVVVVVFFFVFFVFFWGGGVFIMPLINIIIPSNFDNKPEHFASQLVQISCHILCVISENSVDRDQTTPNPGTPDLGHMCFLSTLWLCDNTMHGIPCTVKSQ